MVGDVTLEGIEEKKRKAEMITDRQGWMSPLVSEGAKKRELWKCDGLAIGGLVN